ncbi:hypothetical protein H7J71_15585 [Mycolicibacterium peregrinum]|nr:hypothetical protein [Mycolicibacterium peregrinum]
MQTLHQLGHVAVSHRYRFRHTGGARRVGHVGQIVRFRARQRGARLTLDSGIVDVDHRYFAAVQPGTQFRGADGDAGGRISEHEADPVIGMRGVDRQVSGSGLEHGQDRHDRLGGPGNQQRNGFARSGPVIGQQVRQPIRLLIELAITPRSVAADQGHGLRAAGHLGGEQDGYSHRFRRRPAQRRPVAPVVEAVVLTIVEKVE